MCVRALLCLRAGGSFQGTGCSQDERGGGTTDARRPPERPGSSANHHQPCSELRIRFGLGVPQVLCPGNPAVTGCHTCCFVWVWRLPGEVGSGQRDLVRVQPGCTLQGEAARGSLCCKHSWK